MEFKGRESWEANGHVEEENGSSSEIETGMGTESDEIERSKVGIMRALVEAQDPSCKVSFFLFVFLFLFLVLFLF